MELTTEQELSIRLNSDRVAKLTREQAIAELPELFRQMLLQENRYGQELKKQWGF